MLSVILPTYNEAQNVPFMVAEISRVLAGRPHEILLIDDNSPDGTWRVAQELTHQYPTLHVIRRMHERGLSSAVVHGMSIAKGDILAVMDADGQHDTALLTKLEDSIRSGSADIALASRYIEGGSTGSWNIVRRWISKAGTYLAFALLKVRVLDPMSGFFAIRKELYDRTVSSLHPTGFKILLDILLHVPQTTAIVEIPFVFRQRLAGDSKLSSTVKMEFLTYLYFVILRRYRRLPMVVFSIVLVVLTFYFLPRAIGVSAVYFSSSLRGQTIQAMQTIANREGWLQSDIELLYVHADGMQLLHRLHGLHPPAATCFDVSFSYLQLQPCTE